MTRTFVFEELDTTTREYLSHVRDTRGVDSPGVFAPKSSAMAGGGCISGLILIGLTLALTLTTWTDVILRDPTRVAMLQTAGLLLGGWLLVAGMRSIASKGNKSYAGHWVYADSLHLYEAYREQVTVAPLAGVAEANFTHNYNNGSYQNSVVRVLLDGGKTSVTLKSEAKAEQLVVFLNYLAWARSPDGGERAKLTPAELGGLARYVADHDVEPKNADDSLNLGLCRSEMTEVPEEPTREGRAAPSILPYVVLVAAGVGIYFLMKDVVNPPLRDDAMFELVTHPPIEPMFLRAYLIDERNTRHRQEVLERLKGFYTEATRTVRNRGADPVLREGMAQLLESLVGPDQPTVSLTVTEKGATAGTEAAQKRVEHLRDQLVGGYDKVGKSLINHRGIIGELCRHPGMTPVTPLPGMEFETAREPVGAQLIDFAKKPDEAEHAHIEVVYEFFTANKSLYVLSATVEIRTKLDAPPVVSGYTITSEETFTEDQFAAQLDKLKDRVVIGLVGKSNQQAMPGFGMPGFPMPN